MSKKQLFEIPENPGSVVFFAGREISLDGKTVVEADRRSPCTRDLLSPGALAYCEKHRFNPVFIRTAGNPPVLLGFVFDETTPDPFSCTLPARPLRIAR